jgi:glycosyltransferase involved in cell wall biosynthesis
LGKENRNAGTSAGQVMHLKKIAHVTFDMRIGGAEQVILNLALNTDMNRFDVRVLCLEKEIGPLGRQLEKRKIKIISFNRKPGFDVKLIKDLRDHIVESQIDILHCHQYTPYVYGLLASLGTPCKIIFTEHGRFFPDTKKLKRVMINPVFEKFTRSITAISSATVDALVQFENFSRKRIMLIYNGLDDAGYQNRNSEKLKQKYHISENDFVLGTVARLDPIKNQKMMLHALAELLKQRGNIKLLIIGDGSERKNLEQLAEHLGIQGSVIFTGFRTDVYRFYPVMDIFLLTSFSEGTSMTLIEAMASSLPCIVTDVGGNPEIVEHEKTGLVIPSNRSDLLAGSVYRLMEDAASRKKMGAAGRLRYEHHYTIDKMVEAYQALYE